MTDAEGLPTIISDRLVLRWLTELDVDALFAVFADPLVMRYWSSPPMTDRNQAKQLLDHIHHCFRQRTLWQWGVALRDEDSVIGTCTLLRLDRENRRAEIGYALGSKHWGRGYMHEALKTLLAYVFDEFDLHRLEADIDPRNAASLRTVERLGFQREGYLRERWIVNGEMQDSVIYGLLRREWDKLVESA